jgi:hypothetical protein
MSSLASQVRPALHLDHALLASSELTVPGGPMSPGDTYTFRCTVTAQSLQLTASSTGGVLDGLLQSGRG